MTWAILTGEYPPQTGGVSDYTRQVAEELAAAGDAVHVFTPLSKAVSFNSQKERINGIEVFRIADSFRSKGRAQIDGALRSIKDFRILVQYTPQAFGLHGMNVGFARWINRLARRHVPVDVMFHEVQFPKVRGQSPQHRLLAIVTRYMARQVGRHASRRFVSTPAWERLLNTIDVPGPAQWLAVPTNLPISPAVPAQLLSEPHLLRIGHFGTYGPHTIPKIESIFTELHRSALPSEFLFLGRGSNQFVERLIAAQPTIQSNVRSTGGQDGAATANQLVSCDLMVQWYADGISTRRGSTMASIALGVPVVCNRGVATEPLWSEFDAVSLIDDDSSEAFAARISSLASDRDALQSLGKRGRLLYEKRFDVSLTIQALRSLPPS